MKGSHTKEAERHIEDTSLNKTNEIDNSFLGTWIDKTADFEVTIRKSDVPQKVSIKISDSTILSEDSLKVSVIQTNTIDVLGANNDTVYSFTLNDGDTLTFSTSSKKANVENIPSVSAPVILKRDYSL